jgi:hypothetical protein
MIVNEIDIEGVAGFEAENQTPIPAYGDALKSVENTRQRVQPRAGIGPHLLNLGRSIQGGQNSPKPWNLIRWQPAPFIRMKEPGQGFVAYRADWHFHFQIITAFCHLSIDA